MRWLRSRMRCAIARLVMRNQSIEWNDAMALARAILKTRTCLRSGFWAALQNEVLPFSQEGYSQLLSAVSVIPLSCAKWSSWPFCVHL